MSELWSELWVLLIIAAVTLGAKVLVVVVVIALSWTSHTFLLLLLHLLQSHFDAVLFCSLLLMCLLSFSFFPFFAGWRRKYRARGAAGGAAAYTRPSMGHFAVTATGKWSEAQPFTYFWALSAAAALILLSDVCSTTTHIEYKTPQSVRQRWRTSHNSRKRSERSSWWL